MRSPGRRGALRLGRPALLIGLAALAVVQFIGGLFSALKDHWTPFVRPGYTDFGDYYLYARVGLHQGWSHLYDATAQLHEWRAMGGLRTTVGYLMLYPPPMAWLVAPLTWLPLPTAAAVWGAAMVALFVASWSIAAPGTRWQRWAHLAASLCLFPVIYALMLEQVVILVIFAVVLCWWLQRHGHPLLAGLALLLVLPRPQVVLLVPLALLCAGRWRSVAVFAVGSAIVAAVATLSLGPDGIHQYVARVVWAASGAPQVVSVPGGSVPALLGHGPLAFLGELAVAAVCARAAWAARAQGVDIPVAAGLCGSILATPFLHVQDFTVLVVGGWIFLQSQPSERDRFVLGSGYALLLLRSFINPPGLVPILTLGQVALEAIWLLAMAGWLPTRRPVITAGPRVPVAA